MELVRGQRAKVSQLTTEPCFEVSIQFSGLEQTLVRTVILLTDVDDIVTEHHNVVLDSSTSGHGQLAHSQCGTVRLKSATNNHRVWSFDLKRAPSRIKKVCVVLAIDIEGQMVPSHADNIRNGVASIQSASNPSTPLAAYRFTGSDFGKETALAVLDFYWKDEWRVKAAGEGCAGGLEAFLRHRQASMTTLYAVDRAMKSALPVSNNPPPSSNESPDSQAGSASPDLSGSSRMPTSHSLPLALPTHWPGRITPKVPGDLTRGLGQVVLELPDKSMAMGTGFAISPGGYFLTCAHVVEDAVRIDFCLEGTNLLRPVEVVAVEESCDMALCWVADRGGFSDWLILSHSAEPPSLGEEIGILGYPLGFVLGDAINYSQGVVNSIRKHNNSPLIQADAGAGSGSSGAPLFRRSTGEVLGVHSHGLGARGPSMGMHINMSFDVRNLRNLGWLNL